MNINHLNSILGDEYRTMNESCNIPDKDDVMRLLKKFQDEQNI